MKHAGRDRPCWPMLIPVFGALLIGGCAATDEGQLVQAPPTQSSLTQSSLADASTQFAQRFQCPIERVTANFDAAVANPPPADVAADPGRLAMYNQQQATEIGTTRFVITEGCGRVATYRCVSFDSRHHGEQVGCVLGDHSRLALDVNSITGVVDRVVPAGLRERLGFRAGDVIFQLDHQTVPMSEYARQLNDPQSPGHVVTVLRGSEHVDIPVPRYDD